MRRVTLYLFALLAAGTAWAGPRENVHAAFSKFLAAKSFRATVTNVVDGKQLSSMAYVAPDRYLVHSGRGPETIIIGDNGWMNMNGRTMKLPIPVGRIIAQYRNKSMLDQLGSVTVTDLGSMSVEGKPAHMYHYVVTEPSKADVKLWIGDKSGLPLQIESQGSFMGHASTTRIRYTDYNDPSIRIEAPQG